MIKKALLVMTSLAVVVVGFAWIMYVGNATPVVRPVSAAEAVNPKKPYVVKLHAQWCPICMLTKGVWAQIERAYSEQVNLVVLDFTNQASTDSSRAEARRLGLEKLFDEYLGATGTIVVLDGRTREVTASIHGSRDFAEYRTAIDAVIRRE
jgi:thiol-disulfide isomerase/thioredoxin